MQLTIKTPSPEAANSLANSLTKPTNAWKVTNVANDTVHVFLDQDVESALDLLAAIVTAQPWYMGQNLVLGDALKQTAKILSGRQAQIDAAVDAAVNGDYLAARTPPRRDPLAIDLDGDGIETVGVAAGVLFDHNADGIKTGTGWLKGDDAFLVLDRDGNGTIDSGRELFGVDTIVATDPYGGVQYAANGFVALASIDSNGDQVFNANDAQFTNVRLWRDLNQDGISQANELQGLAAAGITAINLSTHQATKALPGGNTQTPAADVAGIDGSAVSLNLASNPFYRQFPDHLDTTAVADLPDMQGSGSLRDLREASTQSATLQGGLRTLATQGYVHRIACRAIKIGRGGSPANGEWRRAA